MPRIRKVTKRAYQRKAVSIAVSVFTSLALVSTGFATWVVAVTAKKDSLGNVHVATIATKTIVITPDEEERNLCFEPVKEDQTGRVRWDKTNYESLSFHLGATISNFSAVNKVLLEFHPGVHESFFHIEDENETQAEGTPEERYANCVEAKYITYPMIVETQDEIFGDTQLDITEKKEILTVDEDTDYARLDMTFQVSWGEFFDGVNPSLYYDDPQYKGYSKNDDQVVDEMDAFYKAFTGLTPNHDEEDTAKFVEAPFYITITASTAA